MKIKMCGSMTHFLCVVLQQQQQQQTYATNMKTWTYFVKGVKIEQWLWFRHKCI